MPAACRRLLLSAAVASVAAVACGGSPTSTSSPCPPQPRASGKPPSATAGPVTVAADRATVPRGGSVALTVTVTGPAGFAAPCDGPVEVDVTDASDIHVLTTRSAVQPGETCGDTLGLAAGQSLEYHTAWQVDATTPSGSYNVAVSVGDLPQAMVPVVVSGALPGAPAC